MHGFIDMEKPRKTIEYSHTELCGLLSAAYARASREQEKAVIEKAMLKGRALPVSLAKKLIRLAGWA